MKRGFRTAAVAAFATAMSLPSAFARASGFSATTLQVAEAGAAAALHHQAPHYEWQYHYVGHHPRFEGHWVLVR